MTTSCDTSKLRRTSRGACAVDRYTTAWSLGTGTPTSLKPGEYRVTDSIRVAGIRYVTLDDRYRIDSRSCETA